jgi:folate-binding protein YgfZ
MSPQDISSSAMFSPERYTAARQGAVLFDLSGRGRILLTGADRLTYLQGLLTNDIIGLTAGTGCYAALLTPQGRMISDMRVFETGEAALLDVPGERAPDVASHLANFIFSEDAHVQDASETLAHILVLGSASSKAVGGASLRPFENKKLHVVGMDVTAAGNDDYSVPAIDLFVEAISKPMLIAGLVEAGVSTIEEEVVETLRIEAGTPRFGIDMGQDTIPLEAGIEDRAISLTKGCYVGQEVIIRVLHRGHGRVARKLVGLLFPEDGTVPARGEPLHAGDRQVGSVTSAAWSPTVGRPIALGYVHRDFVTPGTTLEAGDPSRQPVTVAALPFSVP